MSGVLWLGPFCAFMSSVTWALGSSGYARLVRDHTAFAVNFSRGLIAFPLFLTVALVSAVLTQGNWHAATRIFDIVDARHFGWFALSILASYGLGDALFLMGSSRTIGIPAALAIASSYPLLTSGWGVFVQGERLTHAQLLGLLATVGGVTIVVFNTPRVPREASPAVAACEAAGTVVPTLRRSTGILLAFVSAFCWAINSYAVARGGQGISAPVANTIRMGIALIFCAIFGKVIFPSRKICLPFAECRKWLWLFVLEAFGGSYFFLYGLSHTPLAVGSTLASVAPVISVPVALVLGLEEFSWQRTTGVVTVVFGLFLLLGG